MVQDNTTEFIDDEVTRMVTNYREMRKNAPHIYREAMWQYADMANGGGADDGTGTMIRTEYYKGYPNSFFVMVLSALGEFERYTTVAMEDKQ